MAFEQLVAEAAMKKEKESKKKGKEKKEKDKADKFGDKAWAEAASAAANDAPNVPKGSS
jgi:hypothetical protein